MIKRPAHRKPRNVPPAPVFVFDKDKNFLCKFSNGKDAADGLGIREGTINTAIYTQKLCQGRWYFSRDESWKPQSLSQRQIAKLFRKLDKRKDEE